MGAASEAILAYGQQWPDGFTETGAGSLDLRVQSNQGQSLITGIGVRANSRFQLGGVTPRPRTGMAPHWDGPALGWPSNGMAQH